MKVVDRFNVSKPPEGPRKYTFEFTGPGLVSLVVVAVFGIAWIFFFGILLGRGNKPENAVPQLAKIMPAPAPAQQESKEQPTVLKPEELQFQETLQGKKPPETVTVDSGKKGDDASAQAQSSAAPPASPSPSVSSASADAPQQPPVPTSTLEKTPAPLPKGQVATAKAEPDRKAARTDAEKSPAKAEKEKRKDATEAKASKEPVRSHAYQVAALEKKSQAESEVERLKKKGVSTTIEEANVHGKTVYRVIAHLKGTDVEIKQALEKTGAKKPILRDKKSL